MPERAYPITEKEQLRRRVLTPQPSRAPHPPIIDVPDIIPASKPEPTKVPGYVFAKTRAPNLQITRRVQNGYENQIAMV